MTYDKTAHIVRLTVRLCRGQTITKKQVMADCEVSIATAKRYIADLSALLPVIGEMRGKERHYLIPQFLRQLQNPPFGRKAA